MTPEQRARTIPPRPSSPGGPRLGGDDLLTDLFEAMAELHFLRDALEGADFVLALALEKLPCEAGLVSLFDINRRQYVIVRQAGGERSGLLLRLSQRAKLAQQAMRFARAIVVEDATATPELVDERWEQIGVVPRSLLCAPVELSGRYLGLIELANPQDGVAFKETDGHAVTYIGRQFAEFVADRGVIVDPDIVLEDIEDDGR
ncbi:MAG: GAF domain-containing protein [Deltaproteobacteria bacterium]|nr:GAF domain-containing protein [Deltaproteobacteria bacterium]MBW2530326.1 GAF domain-containing protein [Deltaproteobacteria bacterium]